MEKCGARLDNLAQFAMMNSGGYVRGVVTAIMSFRVEDGSVARVGFSIIGVQMLVFVHMNCTMDPRKRQGPDEE